MAPEQLDRPAEVDHRADIYSLGVVFYQMLTGELPAKLLEPPSHKVHIDVRLDQIVLKALEKSPTLRFQNATEFKTEVETVISTPSAIPNPEISNFKSEISNLQSAISAATTPVPSAAEKCRRAQQELRIPALGMRICALLNLLVVFLAIAAFFLYRAILYVPSPGIMNAPPHPSSIGGLILVPIFLSFLINLFILISAIRMAQCRSYNRCIAACILTLFAFPLNLPALAFAIWSLILLNRPDIKAAFDQTAAPTAPLDPASARRLLKIPTLTLRVLTLINCILLALPGIFLFASLSFPKALAACLALAVYIYIYIRLVRIEQLRNYTQSLLACLLLLPTTLALVLLQGGISLLFLLANLAALPFITWTLILLSRRDIKAAFQATKSPSAPISEISNLKSEISNSQYPPRPQFPHRPRRHIRARHMLIGRYLFAVPPEHCPRSRASPA